MQRGQLLALAKFPADDAPPPGSPACATLSPNAHAEPAASWPNLALSLGELGGAYHAGSLAPDATRFVAEVLKPASGASKHGSSAGYSAAGDRALG